MDTVQSVDLSGTVSTSPEVVIIDGWKRAVRFMLTATDQSYVVECSGQVSIPAMTLPVGRKVKVSGVASSRGGESFVSAREVLSVLY